ncbi:DUF3047 domain-containing protein [Alcanivorax hongdengensis]|uniref:DUF3047 domain-containing protein n=1 Tax=Alcanivorax hongdengensis TaxID=519051 RepID=UPI0012FC22C3|nr:DUF3047 domain-containing protein [Alcanivorax hongdengensis]
MNTTILCDRLVQCIPRLLALSLLVSPATWAAPLADGWREVSFQGHTRYQPEGDHWCADARASASGLVREADFSLRETPWLHWQWRADVLPDWPAANEQRKGGDDFVARVYVVHKGFFPWQSRAINYVWSRQQPVGAHWPNPFASQAHMVVVQGPGEAPGWHAFARNVREDFQRYHHIDVDQVQALAIMTDTDNTGATAHACYRLPFMAAQSASRDP